jgi:serine/threonine-protein kinase
LGRAILSSLVPQPADAHAHIPLGTVLLGKYRLDRVIGAGGMGTVVEARHLTLDDKVALKFLLPQMAVLPDAVERFLREARSAIRIKSEHVARVMDVASLPSGEPFIVLEFLEGRDLMRILKDEGPLAIPDAVDAVLQAAHALSEAHGLGIIHRDIKPGNLFRARAPDGGTMIKVLDFGLSKVIGAHSIDPLTRTQATMGSAHYMAPEQMHSLRDVDRRADVYSLGVTLFTLLCARHPYPGGSMPAVYAAILTGQPTPLRQVRPEVPEPLERALLKAFMRDPNARYQSIAELAFALAPYAPPQSRATLDRISRLVARPVTGRGTELIRPASTPPPNLGGTVMLDNAAPAPAATPFTTPKGTALLPDTAAAMAAAARHAPAPAGAWPAPAPHRPPGVETMASEAPTETLAGIPMRSSRAPLLFAVLGVGALVAAGFWFALLRGDEAEPAEGTPDATAAGEAPATPTPPPVEAAEPAAPSATAAATVAPTAAIAGGEATAPSTGKSLTPVAAPANKAPSAPATKPSTAPASAPHKPDPFDQR